MEIWLAESHFMLLWLNGKKREGQGSKMEKSHFYVVQEWPEDDYPPYANGPGYIISRDIANFVVSQHKNPVAGIASPSVFLGFAFFFFKLIQSMDTATARRGYRDGKAWLQRRPGMDTATARLDTATA